MIRYGGSMNSRKTGTANSGTVLPMAGNSPAAAALAVIRRIVRAAPSGDDSAVKLKMARRSASAGAVQRTSVDNPELAEYILVSDGFAPPRSLATGFDLATNVELVDQVVPAGAVG